MDKFLKFKILALGIIVLFSSCDLEPIGHDSKTNHHSKTDEYYNNHLDTLNNSISTGLPGGGNGQQALG